MTLKINYLLTAAFLAVLLVFLSVVFGFSGVKTVFGIIIFVIFPVFMILDNFELDFGEKLIYSVFIGFGIVPGLVYYTGLLVPFSVAVFIPFFILAAAGLIIKKARKGYFFRRK